MAVAVQGNAGWQTWDQPSSSKVIGVRSPMSSTSQERSGARAAIVRGEYADVLGSMGPTAITGYASDSNAVAAAARPYLVLMTPSSVRLNITWPDGTNEFGQRVRVATSADFTPMITFIFGSPTWTLTGTSEMHIAH